jgi:hypothetical protein
LGYILCDFFANSSGRPGHFAIEQTEVGQHYIFFLSLVPKLFPTIGTFFFFSRQKKGFDLHLEPDLGANVNKWQLGTFSDKGCQMVYIF